jgi:hypothetical protein
MAPLLVRELIDNIYLKKPLDSMININRFSKKINDENIDYAKSLELTL